MDENGNLEYIQSDFKGEDNKVKITQPRIYFGLQTNEPIVTNAKNKQEYDYPLTSTTSNTNTYEGKCNKGKQNNNNKKYNNKSKNNNAIFKI